ncbi:MAG: site-specific DNA-methyltransferase [Prevotella sp.]|uniref:DNA methyltransferase n=1 Tax=Prevotella sp. TaxID=59823 RepID=UPI0025F96E68|nr:DNA methyltransferase [Prevotella sp.]MCI7183273.1 site-specific DNA-methyltransferase [Prevotella sp.]
MAIRYIPYYPDTLQGQARLDNFVRTNRMLFYKDNDKVKTRVQRGMPLYEVSAKETVGTNDKGNIVMHGECLSTCAYLKDKGIEVDLVYIDPPFASGADYAKKIYIRRNPLVQKAIAEAEQQLDNSDMLAFEEKMYGDIWDKERYLNWMYENLMAIKAVMSDTASIYVHLDDHIGHYVKILMDEIFGEDNYKNDIAWRSTASHNDSSKSFSSISDHIYFYSLSENSVFNTLYTEYTEDYIDSEWTKLPSGRYYKAENMLDPQMKMNAYDFHGTTARWRTTPEKFEILWNAEQTEVPNSHGRIKLGKNGKPIKRCRIVFMDELPGAPVNDIWDDINYVAGRSIEKVDYSTQKPESLLERIIKASSNKGMLVADFFGGSGVTAAVAHKLGRRFIHNDVNINSIQTTRDRLVGVGAEFTMMEIRDGVSLFRNPVQTMDKLVKLIPGLNTDANLDKRFWAGSIFSSQNGQMPVYLPNLLDSSCRVMDTTEMNHIIREALPDLSNDVKHVIVYYIDVEDMEALNQFIHDENTRTDIEIELRDLKQILDEVVMEDEATWTLSEVQVELFTKWQVKMLTFHSDYVMKKIEAFNLKANQQHTKKVADGKKSTFKPIEISDEGLECIEWLSVDCTSAQKDAPWHSDAEVKIEKNGTVTINGNKTRDLWDATIISEDKPLRLKVRNICGDETVFIL